MSTCQPSQLELRWHGFRSTAGFFLRDWSSGLTRLLGHGPIHHFTITQRHLSWKLVIWLKSTSRPRPHTSLHDYITSLIMGSPLSGLSRLMGPASIHHFTLHNVTYHGNSVIWLISTYGPRLLHITSRLHNVTYHGNSVIWLNSISRPRLLHIR
jgi:hypothetical protein